MCWANARAQSRAVCVIVYLCITFIIIIVLIGVGLKAASELHKIIAKDQEQLADLIHKEFELPLQRNLATHAKRIEENERIYEKTKRKMQDEISKTESKMLKGRKKDLSMFQQSLQDMQRQAGEMERLEQENYEKMLTDEQKNLMFLVQKTAGVLKVWCAMYVLYMFY